jgi:uncharacterized protein
MKQEESFTDYTYFFDSYAFIEIIKGNENYKEYVNSSIITTKLNLFELYHSLLKNNFPFLAESAFNTYYKFTIDFEEETIKEAVKMKLALNKRHISMTDCIGYMISKKLGIKFLTGDKEFENM